MSNQSVDNHVRYFCQESLEVLKYNNDKIRDNMIGAEDRDFYEYLSKGLNVVSITEPIIKFLIFSSLCKKFRIWPEVKEFYSGRKFLDLAIYSPFLDKSQYTNEELVIPDIAIEMKWGGIKKSGQYYDWSLKNLVEDAIKLKKNCQIPNKYIMQFIIVKDYSADINEKELINQVYNKIDKRSFRNNKLDIIFCDYFDTNGMYISEKHKFFIVLWKIA